MISFINGKLIEVETSHIVVETGGIGFLINFPSSNIRNLPEIGETVKIWTFMNVKEDEMSLYGFLTVEDKEMFLKLLTVNGVGPKGALNIISQFGFSDLIKAIANDDNKLIATVPGIGAKTASKICIELGDKVRKLKFEGKVDIIKKNNDETKKIGIIKDEVVAALEKLGIKETKARDILNTLDIPEGISSDELLKMALRAKG